MSRFLLVIFCSVPLAGCVNAPAKATRIRSPEAQSAQRVAYDNFVAQRTGALQRMGGPFKDKSAATTKALAEAAARFGDVPADWSTTWSWGKDAGRNEAQAELNEELDKLARNKNKD